MWFQKAKCDANWRESTSALTGLAATYAKAKSRVHKHKHCKVIIHGKTSLNNMNISIEAI